MKGERGMRSGGENHLSLANTSVQKMIKMTPVTPCSSLVTWSVGEVWAAHGFMRCISSINTGSVFLSTQDRSPLPILLFQYFYHFFILLRITGVHYGVPCVLSTQGYAAVRGNIH